MTNPPVPVRAPGRHPRAVGFRDGLIASTVLLALAGAGGLLGNPGLRTSSIAVESPSGPAAADTHLTPGLDQSAAPSDVAPSDTALSPVMASVPWLTLIYLPKGQLPRGTDMRDGCGFMFDLGPGTAQRTWRGCPGPEGPTQPLSTLYADPGAAVFVENWGFTPSTEPANPPVACGRLTGQPAAFVEDARCRPGYVASTNGEFTFLLPSLPGRWVIAVRGCEQLVARACGAWYAELDTVDAAPSP